MVGKDSLRNCITENWVIWEYGLFLSKLSRSFQLAGTFINLMKRILWSLWTCIHLCNKEIAKNFDTNWCVGGRTSQRLNKNEKWNYLASSSQTSIQEYTEKQSTCFCCTCLFFLSLSEHGQCCDFRKLQPS